MRLNDCYNFDDFKKLAKKNLPAPIFHYIDGGADDEVTLRRNTESFSKCDLVPSILTSVGEPDLTTEVLGKKLKFQFFYLQQQCSGYITMMEIKPVQEQQKNLELFIVCQQWPLAQLKKFQMFLEDQKMFQLYIHKDQGLTDNLIERCKRSGFNAMCLTVDTVVAGNRERDHRWGFTTPPKLTFKSLLSFALHPMWSVNYLTHEKFKLANVSHFTKNGSSIAKGVMEYINEQYDPKMSWKDAEYCIKKWGGPFAIKGVMSVEDAKRAVQIGASAIMLSNHGGRQLDGSRAPFDQLPAIADAVGGKIEIILDGGIRRGTHVLKALSLGATACSFGKGFLFALGAGGQKGVEALLQRMHDEIRRDMILLGCKTIKDLNKTNIAYR